MSAQIRCSWGTSKKASKEMLRKNLGLCAFCVFGFMFTSEAFFGRKIDDLDEQKVGEKDVFSLANLPPT